MTGKQKKLAACIFSILLAGAAGAGATSVSSDDVSPIPVEVENRRKGRDKKPNDGARVETLMEAKLDYAEKILAGLVTHDFDQVAKSAESLKLISLSHPRGWEKKEHDDEIYDHFRIEFMRQAARLEEEARKENLAGAAYFQQNLTATCIACHDYIRDEDLTK